jgi:anaerobic magnesium-protoporphyrin IX monomethyl ester cyclase
MTGSQGTVVLIGYQDRENLGLRYLCSCLRRQGHQAYRVTFSADPEETIKTVLRVQPDIVGFSLIFQNLASDFARVISLLRRSGCSAHFTMGGHYPSFDYVQAMESMPELDSVVRFEGEQTLLSLLQSVLLGSPLDEVKGIAWRRASGEIVANAPRPGCASLDVIPWPDRDDLEYRSGRLSTALMIGSRGCSHNCFFCSIAAFYKQNGTPGRRLRNPHDVVDEMEMLHGKGADVILFQDDDFLAGGETGIGWAHSISAECIRRGLNKTLRWRISCRSDEATRENLAPLAEGGLSHVYLGVESGNIQDLHDLNKGLSPEAHFVALETLQGLHLTFDFGFMLLTPWSTFETIRSNLSFLREFIGDGQAAAGFCRTLPYAGTVIAQRLRQERRLLPGCLAEYNFSDPRLDALNAWLYGVFNTRNNDPYGTRNLLSVLLFETSLDLPKHPRNPTYEVMLRALVSVSNRVMIDAVAAAAGYFESLEKPPPPNDPFLAELAAYHEEQDSRVRADLTRWCNARLRTLATP